MPFELSVLAEATMDVHSVTVDSDTTVEDIKVWMHRPLFTIFLVLLTAIPGESTSQRHSLARWHRVFHRHSACGHACYAPRNTHSAAPQIRCPPASSF